MRIIIGENKKGATGFVDEGVLIDIFTGEITVTDEYKEVGYVDPPSDLNTLPGQLYHQFTLKYPLSAFYLVGNVSVREQLDYVPLNESVMMGFSNDLAMNSGNVYFFKKCGELKGKSLFTYTSDMVVQEDAIKWVHQGDSPTIVRHG